MKKIIFLVPVVLALAMYIILGITSGFGAISPYVWVNIALMLVSAFLMLNNKWYGCVGGLIVGGILIFAGTQYTGQVIDVEMPLGIVLCVCYLICGFVIYRKGK